MTKPQIAREQRFVFDEIAELYARTRPTYPADLIEDLIRAAGLQPRARVLELGAGPGTASVLFAGRGYDLLCLEPGARLASVAMERLASDPAARVEVATFEDWSAGSDRFDLVFAAQSFHWIDPAIRFSKAADVLRPRGMLAIFANRPLRGATPSHVQIQQVYAEHAPELVSRGIDTNTRGNFLEMFGAAPDFEQATCQEYRWHEEYNAMRYVELLQTHSDHRLLSANRLGRLLDGVRAVIEENGGLLAIDYVTVLCHARTRSHGGAG